MRGKNQDAHGRLIYDYFKGRPLGVEIVEKDDGFINSGAGGTYLSQYKDWPDREKSAIRLARGRVLDIGCGAGRHSLFLQEKGLDVTGVDLSPLAIQVYKVTVDTAHRRYHLMNISRDRMPGQVKIRIRYRSLATPWFDYLLASKKEMKQILNGTGWRAKRFFSSKGPSYIAIIERD